MTRTLRLTIPGQPVPKQRPRRGAHGNWYTPRETQDYEEMVRVLARSAMRGQTPMEEIVRVHVWVHGRKGRRDADNCLKAVLDGLTGAAYLDDSQVVDCRIAWDGVPVGEDMTTVLVEEVG